MRSPLISSSARQSALIQWVTRTTTLWRYMTSRGGAAGVTTAGTGVCSATVMIVSALRPAQGETITARSTGKHAAIVA